jgi:hypothetical protein
MDVTEHSPLLHQPNTIVSSPARWWMCFVLSAISFEQGMIWNTWGPISPAVQNMLSWSDGTIALLANWARLCCVLLIIRVLFATSLQLYQRRGFWTQKGFGLFVWEVRFWFSWAVLLDAFPQEGSLVQF